MEHIVERVAIRWIRNAERCSAEVVGTLTQRKATFSVSKAGIWSPATNPTFQHKKTGRQDLTNNSYHRQRLRPRGLEKLLWSGRQKGAVTAVRWDEAGENACGLDGPLWRQVFGGIGASLFSRGFCSSVVSVHVFGLTWIVIISRLDRV